MRQELDVTRIEVDIRRNRLALELDGPMPAAASTAIVDIGAYGRLQGMEIAGVYLAIADPDPGAEMMTRSVTVDVEVSSDRRRVDFLRRGPGWEVSFPSGNQCWRVRGAQGERRPLCAVKVRR